MSGDACSAERAEVSSRADAWRAIAVYEVSERKLTRALSLATKAFWPWTMAARWRTVKEAAAQNDADFRAVQQIMDELEGTKP